MTTLNFTNTDRKEIKIEQFIDLINSIGLNWWGIDNWSQQDLLIFEKKFDGYTVSFKNNKPVIWFLDFDYEEI